MATPKAAWGIEIGSYAIKAIRLERDGENVSVSDFAVIPHKKVLTTPDLDQDEMVRLSLGQFISQKSLEGEHLVMSVPGHAAFARFAKLPPVEPKKVPDIVKFEAVQQIPFPIDEVEWDYETFTSPDTPEIEVGIFAITRERVQQRLSLYGELGISPEAMTLSPVALYNAMAYDLAGRTSGAVVYLDIGTQATDVVVAEQGRCWIRTFPLGGTHFTEAIASAFKLSYSKAEKLKLEASDSKYAKQIMQAMRPVFSDLLQDLQRSIGYYQSTHRESELKTMVGVGSTFKIPGLRKFLGQQLQIDVLRLDEYKRIAVTGREAASFAESAVNMATAYGLALQGVGLAPISANLVPVKVLREQLWAAKTKWFAAAAAIVIAGSAMTLYRPLVDRSKMEPAMPSQVNEVISRGGSLRQQVDGMLASANVGAKAANMVKLLENRSIWPYLLNDAAAALASTDPQPELLRSDLDAILSIDPKQRRLVRLRELSGQYIPPEDPRGKRRISVTMAVELSHERPNDFLTDTVAQWLRDNAERPDVPYRIIAASVSTNPTAFAAFTVDTAGQVQGAGAGVGASASSSGPTLPGFTPPAIQPGVSSPTPPPTRGGGFSGSGGGSGGLKRGGIGSTVSAPGIEMGTTISGGGSPSPSPSPANQDPSRRPGLGGSSGTVPPLVSTDEQGTRNIDELAPLPARPLLYPPNSTFYHYTITFDVELLDESASSPASAAGTAARPTQETDAA